MMQRQELKQQQKDMAFYQKFFNKVSHQKQLLFAKFLKLHQATQNTMQIQSQKKQSEQAAVQIQKSLQQIFKIHSKTKTKIQEIKQNIQFDKNTEILKQISDQYGFFENEYKQVLKQKQKLLEEQGLLQKVFKGLFDYLTQRNILSKREDYSKYLDKELLKLQEFKKQINQIFAGELILMKEYLQLIQESIKKVQKEIKDIQSDKKQIQKMIKEAQERYELHKQEEKDIYQEIQKIQGNANSFNPAKKLQNLSKINNNNNNISNISDLDDADSYNKKHKNSNNHQSAFHSTISEGLNYMRQFQQPRSSIIYQDQPSIKVTNIEYVESLTDQYKNNRSKWNLLACLISLSLIYVFILA